MQIDPRAIAVRYVTQRLCARIAALKSSDPESGALSLEWVAIAVVLVAAALALATFLTGKLSAIESLIPN
jgi:Flp pilus assembly pilin Flp